MRSFVGAAVVALLWSGSAYAECPALPNQIVNGQPADASKVMGDLNHLRDCLNGDTGTISTPSVSIKSPAGPAATIKAPSVPTAYDFNLPNGPGIAGQVLRSGGPSAAATWGTGGSGGGNIVDGNPTVRPNPALLSWINQASSTLTDYPNGPVTLRIETTGSSNLHALEMPIPGASFTITAKLDCTVLSGYTACGIYVRDSLNKMVFIGYSGSSLGYTYRDGFNGNNMSLSTSAYIYSAPKWFRITRDASSMYYSFSSNGADWVLLRSIPNASGYLTGTIAGAGVVGLTDYNYPTNIPIWSLELKTGAGTNSSWQ